MITLQCGEGGVPMQTHTQTEGEFRVQIRRAVVYPMKLHDLSDLLNTLFNAGSTRMEGP